jgi:hypothetical protein
LRLVTRSGSLGFRGQDKAAKGKDGKIDEDWLNGRDDDGDTRIDEDYAAISKQMFSCWYTDNQPVALQIFPEHNPLNLFVRQESYQWEEDRFDDFVGVEFHITNIGTDVLRSILGRRIPRARAGTNGGGQRRELYYLALDGKLMAVDIGGGRHRRVWPARPAHPYPSRAADLPPPARAGVKIPPLRPWCPASQG